MPRYIIERDILDIGNSSDASLSEAAAKSNSVLADMKSEHKRIQWEHSYVLNSKTYCIYIAENKSLIQEHSERSGFPITNVTRVATVIDPVTEENRL